MSSNLKPLIALGLTAAGTALVANFQVQEPIPLTAAAPAGTTAEAPTTSSASTPAGTTKQTTTGSTSSSTTRAQQTPAPSATATPDTSSTLATSSGGAYADGTYTGAAVREPWGTFEVQITVSGGQVTGVDLVAEPRDRHSSSINSYAVPQLTQEALATQSSNIDWISGATWTSQSYTTSLQAALDDATAAKANAG